MQHTSVLVYILSAWLALPALADVTSPSGKVTECYCTNASGARIDLGETICLHVDGKLFMAQCQMSLNVPMWRKLQDGCAVSSLQSKVATLPRL